jgi:hypothetical protein
MFAIVLMGIDRTGVGRDGGETGPGETSTEGWSSTEQRSDDA